MFLSTMKWLGESLDSNLKKGLLTKLRPTCSSSCIASRYASGQNYEDSRRISTPDVLIVEEGTSFKAGTLLDIGVQTWRIRAIHTGEGRTLRGTVDASNIKECICMSHHDLNDSNQRRQENDVAWKEGRLGFNPNPILPKEQIKKRVKPSNKRKKKKARK